MPEAISADIKPELAKGKQNTLIVIGWMGVRRAYLNVPREEAILRYSLSDGIEPSLAKQFADEFTFADEFGVYDAWEVED